MNDFTPEPWQGASTPTEDFSVPEYVTALLLHLSYEIERVEGNRRQEPYEAPTGWDTGEEYSTDVFTMRGFRYPDDEEFTLPNLEAYVPAGVPRCPFVRLCWYKHLGRSMSCNVVLSPAEWVTVYENCMASVRATERNRDDA